ncbi:unnamed protein product [Spodoptera littoralis]|uniref:SCP domain-containing protein n=1 Tax=Spodoptera littoralis TaxID=7109 RepID=A0A9P0N4X0_SPOLI|nr:unnamed protein product [Spodoptera littoralis]CAH1641625.1 unnamed protein product [Spodoptera littoralis]
MFSIKLIPVLLVIELRLSRSSLVIDHFSQKSISISDYCPSFEFCKEGAHVMCVHYNPNRVLGPKCNNGQNASIDEVLAVELLDVTNEIRSRIANGIEIGKDGQLLPRGYGIFRLDWDNELATFAQVLANQCTLRHDLCRSTKRFPDPGQVVSIERFSYPDWKIITSKNNNRPGLTEEKLMSAVMEAFKYWYRQKRFVNEQMVMVYPDFNLTPQFGPNGRLYLELINGGATHMGCGVSAFSEYIPFQSKFGNNFNSIILVCNYSARSKRGDMVYNTKPPTPGQGYSSKCGCPPGSKEDEDCLCNLVPIEAKRKEVKCNSLDGKGCEPTLVLLPIFTTEDAPPDKLFKRADSIRDPMKDFIFERMDNSTVAQRMRQYQNMFDDFTSNSKAKQSNLRLDSPKSHPPRTAEKKKSPHSSNVMYKVQVAPPAFIPTENPPLPSPTRPALPPRIPPPPPPPPLPPPPLPPPRRAYTHHKTRAPPPIPPRPRPRKPSHARTSPKRDYTPARRAHDSQPIDATRSDDEFNPSKKGSHRISQKLSHKQLTKKSSLFTKAAKFNLPARKNIVSYLETPQSDVHVDDITTETILKTAEEKDINFNQYSKKKKYNMDNRTRLDKVFKDENDKDNKLLSLLNTLEKEVKHIALDGKEKVLFDAKIRKIYGSIVGTTDTTLLSPITTNANDLDIAEIDIGNPRSRKYNKNFNANGFRNTKEKHDAYFHNKYNHNYNYKFDSDVEQKYMDDFENKYIENLGRNKYSENNVDGKFDTRHKYIENDPKYHYDDSWNRRYDGTLPVHKNTLKYEGKDFNEFRDFKHNSLTSMEDNAIRHSNLMNFRKREFAKSGYHRPDRDDHRSKEPKRKHRDEIEIKRNKIYHYRDDDIDDPLSIERRRFFQERLDNIERRLLSRTSDHRGNRIRRMKPSLSRTSSKPESYIPHRARILHSVMYEYY